MTNKKISPIKEKTLESSRETYSELFSDIARYINIKLKWRGIHTLTYNTIKDDLDNTKSVLDIGCGYGRLSFLIAQRAKKVVGIDMTARAIDVCNAYKKAMPFENVEFLTCDVESYQTKGELFDYIILGGVLEHLINPTSIMKTISSILKPGGILISNSPTEFNFRGNISTTLNKLFNFPTSLSDVRVITHSFMEKLGQKHNFTLFKKIGVSYMRGWSKLGCDDMKQRVRNVLHDVKEQTKDINFSLNNFDSWLDENVKENNKLVNEWIKNGHLKTIPTRPELPVDKKILANLGLPKKEALEFLAPDFHLDPYYSDVEPYCSYGGQTIYYLKKN